MRIMLVGVAFTRGRYDKKYKVKAFLRQGRESQ